MRQVGPFALHQQHVAHVQLGGYQIIRDVFVAASATLSRRGASASLHTQHVDAESLAQVGLADAQTGEVGGRHHNDFRQSQVVEINLHVLHPPQSVILGKALHLLLVTYYI